MERNESCDFLKNTEYRDVLTESGCDYSLPDYKGDVKRVLHTSVQVMPSGKFMDNSELSFSGIVLYNVVYLNSENAVEGIEFTSDYDFSVKAGGDGIVDFDNKTRVSAFSVRLTGPRKFSAKCSIASTVSVLAEESIVTDYDIGDSEPELAICTANVMHKRFYSAKEREYAEKLLTLDSVIADDVKIISSGATVNIASVIAGASEASVKGNILIDFVLSCGDVPPYSEHRSIPFEESIPIDAAEDAANIKAVGIITSLKLTVNPEDFGSDIVADIIAEFSAQSICNSEVRIATDGYLVSCDSTPSFEQMHYTEFITSAQGHEKIECRAGLGELGIENIREVICSFAGFKSDECTLSGNNAEIKGEVRFSGIASQGTDEGDVTYCGFKQSAPISINVNLNCQTTPNMRAEHNVFLSDACAMIDKDKLVLSCSAAADVTVFEAKSINRMASICSVPDTECERCASKITVYYPAHGETLFDVAKKFKTTVKDIAVNNSLTESVMTSLEGGAPLNMKKLIIR